MRIEDDADATPGGSLAVTENMLCEAFRTTLTNLYKCGVETKPGLT